MPIGTLAARDKGSEERAAGPLTRSTIERSLSSNAHSACAKVLSQTEYHRGFVPAQNPRELAGVVEIFTCDIRLPKTIASSRPSPVSSRGRLTGLSGRGEQHLQRPGVGGIAEDVVGGLELVKAESVGDHRRGVELVTGDQTDQCRGRVGVDKPGGDGQVLDPDVLQVQSRRRSVHADVGDMSTGAD